jgi:hypothetical protein
MSKTFSKANRQELRSPFSLDFFLVLSHFRAWFSAMGVQKHYKKRFANKSRRKVLFFWSFLGEGTFKHHKQLSEEKNPALVLFCL